MFRNMNGQIFPKIENLMHLYVLLDEISNVPPDGEASGPEAAGETPLCSDQETARSESSNQAHMQLCWSSTQNKFVLICQRISFNKSEVGLAYVLFAIVFPKNRSVRDKL
jgi:hypothetical protein